MPLLPSWVLGFAGVPGRGRFSLFPGPSRALGCRLVCACSWGTLEVLLLRFFNVQRSLTLPSPATVSPRCPELLCQGTFRRRPTRAPGLRIPVDQPTEAPGPRGVSLRDGAGPGSCGAFLWKMWRCPTHACTGACVVWEGWCGSVALGRCVLWANRSPGDGDGRGGGVGESQGLYLFKVCIDEMSYPGVPH